MVPPSNDCEIGPHQGPMVTALGCESLRQIGSSVLASTTRMGAARRSHHQNRFLRIANRRRRPATARAWPIPFRRL
jgi:hypothetical protein